MRVIRDQMVCFLLLSRVLDLNIPKSLQSIWAMLERILHVYFYGAWPRK